LASVNTYSPLDASVNRRDFADGARGLLTPIFILDILLTMRRSA